MYYKFQVDSIKTFLEDKQIVIKTNMEIDRNDETGLMIEVFERNTRNPVMFYDEIIDDKLIIHFRDWPSPNVEYVISVKGLKSVTKDPLATNIKRKVIFESKITSLVKILRPSHFAKVEDPYIKIEEIKTKEDDELINSYYLEVAYDSNFVDIPYKTVLENNNEMHLAIKKHGQYFLRVRAQKRTGNDIEYGRWSETISFVYGNQSEDGDSGIIDFDENKDFMQDFPIVIDEVFEIKEYPEVGVTPESFLFEFSLPIEDVFIDDNILIIKKEVR